MDLSQKLDVIKGIGEKTMLSLEKAGITTLRDLLYYLPRTYEDYQALVKIIDLKPGKVIVKGKISDLKTSRTRRRNLTITNGVIRDDTGAIRVVWFNQPYRVKQFTEGKDYYFTGTFELKSGKYQLSSPSAVLSADVEKTSGFQPIYAQKSVIKPSQFKLLIEKLRPYFGKIDDLLPIIGDTPTFLKPQARKDALFNAHFPDNSKEAEDARRYLAYEELFELLLAARLNRRENQKLQAIELPFRADRTRKLVESLSFKLTRAQRRATWEILQDLEKSTPMNRLLQGDVGAGKTLVATLAIAQTVQNGHQAVLLAPTAILATQHAENIRKILEPLGVKIALLTGATKNKRELKKLIMSGEIDLVVGTHAVLTDDTTFKSLALCVIDEQHRFGVGQRQKLLEKSDVVHSGIAPHLLAMTATPIPRSLQLTIFGDLEVSILDELPKGRKPIDTKIIHTTEQTDELYPAIREALGRKEQVYWICKMIEDETTTELASVKKQTKRLQTVFPHKIIEFLHGKMKNSEKDAIMERFARGEIDILVSTTVVEVGIDVPNATMIVIMDADLYGLAQLHQLRGRVGRGEQTSQCYLMIDGENPPSRRLREMEKSTDGFYLAEVDLKLRGPGEIYGSLQHGALDLRIATLSDTKLINLASKHVDSVIKMPDFMLKYKELAQDVKKYQQLTTLN